MKAWAIVWGTHNNGVTVRLPSGNLSLAVFPEYMAAVKTLAGFKDADDHKIIEVEITLA